ncbi:hypothetical protein [Nonomuraea indica]|uniref:Uncharacterized protein n=1 Tax=Nonomuraea indica TaxID=1581193 RepID=A0ABW8A8W1_9ACTN
MDITTGANHGQADSSASEKIGSVSIARYQQLVARILEIDEQHMRGQFEAGDAALEIEGVPAAMEQNPTNPPLACSDVVFRAEVEGLRRGCWC